MIIYIPWGAPGEFVSAVVVVDLLRYIDGGRQPMDPFQLPLIIYKISVW
jgi:hypothetical protein